MSVVTTVGILMILAFSLMTFANLRRAKVDHKYILIFGVAGLCAGTLCVFNTPLTEISFGTFGSVRTSAERASASADAIAEIGRKVQGIEKSVAEKNEEALKKLKALSSTLQNASASVKDLESVSEFVTTLAAALAEDRPAFDRLEKWADDPRHS